jgi:hypothetical protein
MIRAPPWPASNSRAQMNGTTRKLGEALHLRIYLLRRRTYMATAEINPGTPLISRTPWPRSGTWSPRCSGWLR